MASPGVPAFTVVTTGQVFVDVSISEGLVDKARNGQAVEVTVDAYPGRTFKGLLTNLAPAADARTRSFAARVQLANGDNRLKPGMFATVKFVTEAKRDVLVIPGDALVDRDGDQIVYVVENGTAAERSVKTGLSDGHSVEILQGLAEGDQVVVAGQTQLAAGIAVKVQNEVK
jgi:membrane fusion protein (multidrug efflux system)